MEICILPFIQHATRGGKTLDPPILLKSRDHFGENVEACSYNN